MDVSLTDRISQGFMDFLLKPTAIAIAFVIVALIWTFPLQHIITYPFVFLFFGAIMGSAWFGGTIAGFIAVLFSSLLVTYLFIPPLYSMTVAKGSQSFLTAFIASAIAIMFVSSARRRSEAAIREARDQLEEKVRDRTAELEQSNREILEREHQLRLLTEAIPQQIWRTDAAGSIDYCNQHLLDFLGRSMDELIGDGFFRIIHPEDELIFRQQWSAALNAGMPFEAEVRIRDGKGAYRWFIVRSIPQRAEDGAIARWYGIHIDIEAQHRAQQSLANAHEEQARVAHTLSMAEMAASIAHELNQPLTAVITHASACRRWLQNSPANLDRAAATAEKLVQESTRAGAVIQRVRALFRKERVIREAGDLNAVIREVVWLLRDETIRHEVSIRLALAPDLPASELDSVQIQQVLINLAMNAIEAMHDSPCPRALIFRSTARSLDEVQISVEDNGPGIPKEVKAHIFDPFYTTKREGTGMGLAICRSIIETHNGRIWAENAPDRGTVIHFTVRNAG
jgi:PAS domain S-box-containing protein